MKANPFSRSKTWLRAASGIAACAVSLAATPTQAHDASVVATDDQIGIEVFYDALAPHGVWVDHAELGLVWQPRGVAADWRPYTAGQWVWTDDDGWYWVSDWEWGWAPFHYGRWSLDRAHGWLWVPGTQWAPAWVAWHEGDDYIGWAPLSPAVAWHAGVGLALPAGHLDAFIDWGAWVFVDIGHFTSRRLVHHVVPRSRNSRLVRVTHDITRYSVERHRAVNHGVSVRRIEARTGSRVRVERLADSHTLGEARVHRVGDDAPIRVFRPSVRATGHSGRPSPLVVHREGRVHRDIPRTVTVERHEVHDRSRVPPRTVDARPVRVPSRPAAPAHVTVVPTRQGNDRETVKVKVKVKERGGSKEDKHGRRRH